MKTTIITIKQPSFNKKKRKNLGEMFLVRTNIER